jgi:hypothetical protein
VAIEVGTIAARSPLADDAGATLVDGASDATTGGAADATALGAASAVTLVVVLGALAEVVGADTGSGCFPQPSIAATATIACARDIRIIFVAIGAGAATDGEPQKGQLSPWRT